MSWELIDKCTFLHLGEDENVSDWTGMTANANSSFRRVYRELCVSFYYGGSSAIGNIFPDELGKSLPLSKLFHWQWQWYVVREHY